MYKSLFLHIIESGFTEISRVPTRSGCYPNNAAERAIKPFVIGCKSFLFAAKPAGARALANLYAMVETAKANGAEPRAYLKKAFTALLLAKAVDQVEPVSITGCYTYG